MTVRELIRESWTDADVFAATVYNVYGLKIETKRLVHIVQNSFPDVEVKNNKIRARPR